jgi:hypothetical protein
LLTVPRLGRQQAEHLEVLGLEIGEHLVIRLQRRLPVAADSRPVGKTLAEAEVDAHPAGARLLYVSEFVGQQLPAGDLALVAHRPAILKTLSALRRLNRRQKGQQYHQQHQRGSPTHPDDPSLHTSASRGHTDL